MWQIKGLKKEDLIVVATELGQIVTPDLKVFDLKELIENSNTYKNDSDFVKEFLLSTVEGRREKEKQEQIRAKEQENERQEKEKMQLELEREKMQLELAKIKEQENSALELEKMKLELAKTQLEIIKAQAQSENKNDSSASVESDVKNLNNTLENLIKSVRTLTMQIPTKPESWSLFFNSLERAFETKNVPEDLKSEILINLLGEKAANILVYIKDDEIKDYATVKSLVLREFQPSPQVCLQNFLRARRSPNETHIQFCSRLTASWEYYCKLKEVEDFETLNHLIIADKLIHTLDSETKAHINVRQGEKWFKPVELAKECDIFFTSRGKSFSDFQSSHPKFRNFTETGNNYNTKYVPPPLRENKNFKNKTSNNECHRTNHLTRNCSQRFASKTEIQQAVDKKEDSQRKNKHNDKLVAKIVSPHLKTEVPVQPLQRVNVWIGGKEIEAIIDSGSQLPILNSNFAPSLRNEGHGKIDLISAFGETISADVMRIPISIKSDNYSFIYNTVDLIIAVTDKLHVPCILPPNIYELLISTEKENNNASQSDIVIDIEDKGGNQFEFPILNESNSQPAEMENNIVSMDELLNNLEGEEINICEVDVKIDEEQDFRIENQKSDATKFKIEQQNCDSLKRVREEIKLNKGNYIMIDDLIYHKDKVLGQPVTQLVLPKNRREQVLKLSHESIFGNHMGMKKTKERIRYSFHWPGMSKDIEEFCRTCKACQLKSPERSRDKIPITPVERPNFPFEVVNIDIIGPIDPPSARKHKYVLCLIDQHSRWPEAIPLKSLTAKATCDALLEIFMRTGIPRCIASDQGTNFISKLTQEFHARLGTHPKFSTPGYPASNGLVERYNKVLKQMLHHVIRNDPKNWDKHLPYLLFAYREIPNCTTGVSPFRLMYGREARGPLAVLKSTWSGEIPLPLNISQTAIDYLQELKVNLEKAVEQASLVAEGKQNAYAEYFNRRAKPKEFKEGDQVYLLIPDSDNKLYARWTGPAEVIARCNPHSYKVKLLNGKIRHVHVNKIRRFYPRIQTVGVIFENEAEFGDIHPTPFPQKNEELEDLDLKEIDLTHLDDIKKKDITRLLLKYKALFSGKVKAAKVGEHKIRLIPGLERKKPYVYRIPESLKPHVDKQIEELLELGLITESEAEIAHPVVCVYKKDGSIRLCVDYRSLNAATKTDDFPMENTTELMYSIGKANVITTIDLLKGYWGIPMEEKSKELTSFKTHRAQYCFNVMPFGLKNAAATFQRVMNKALMEYKEFARAYIDDIAVFSSDWDTHLRHLDIIFSKLEELGFTANLQKCSFAKHQIRYLGHIIGSGKHQTDPEKIKAIKELVRPQTKKQLKSLLGLCNYYREYISHYAEIAYPLTELTKKKVPEQLPWTEEHEKAFLQLKKALVEATDLYTPNLGEEFVIQSDASLTGIGACLSQRRKGSLYPISYASQKLTKAQQAWPTIEREAFAVVWSLKKFEPWIFGSHIDFITDHNPLAYITKNAPQSSKLQRWALALQKYDLTMSHSPGSKLVNADALSRLNVQDEETVLC